GTRLAADLIQHAEVGRDRLRIEGSHFALNSETGFATPAASTHRLHATFLHRDAESQATRAARLQRTHDLEHIMKQQRMLQRRSRLWVPFASRLQLKGIETALGQAVAKDPGSMFKALADHWKPIFTDIPRVSSPVHHVHQAKLEQFLDAHIHADISQVCLPLPTAASMMHAARVALDPDQIPHKAWMAIEDSVDLLEDDDWDPFEFGAAPECFNRSLFNYIPKGSEPDDEARCIREAGALRPIARKSADPKIIASAIKRQVAKQGLNNAAHGLRDRAEGMVLLGGARRRICDIESGATIRNFQTLPKIAAVFDAAHDLGSLQQQPGKSFLILMWQALDERLISEVESTIPALVPRCQGTQIKAVGKYLGVQLGPGAAPDAQRTAAAEKWRRRAVLTGQSSAPIDADARLNDTHCPSALSYLAQFYPLPKKLAMQEFHACHKVLRLSPSTLKLPEFLFLGAWLPIAAVKHARATAAGSTWRTAEFTIPSRRDTNERLEQPAMESIGPPAFVANMW
ncbi:unnamed protein product, partial [Prorocentrum cordatum]